MINYLGVGGQAQGRGGLAAKPKSQMGEGYKNNHNNLPRLHPSRERGRRWNHMDTRAL